MSKREELPEEATQEPRTLTPAELGERATRAFERSAEIEESGEEPDLADPRNPLRMPGELSSKPKDVPAGAMSPGERAGSAPPPDEDETEDDGAPNA